MLASRADLHHTDSITPLGPVSRQAVRAVFSEGQDGLVNDFDGLSDFILLDDEGRRQADDVAVRGLGQQPVVAEAQTHLPGIVICKGREGQHQQGPRALPAQQRRCHTCSTGCCLPAGRCGMLTKVTRSSSAWWHCSLFQHTEFCSFTARCLFGTQTSK